MADIKRQKLFLERSVKSMQSDVDDYQTLAEEKNHISYLQHSHTSLQGKQFLGKPFGKVKIPLKIPTRQLEEWSVS